MKNISLNLITLSKLIDEFQVEQNCASAQPCGICEVEPQKRLRLKGLCVDDLRDDSDFDVEYYADGILNGKIHFR